MIILSYSQSLLFIASSLNKQAKLRWEIIFVLMLVIFLTATPAYAEKAQQSPAVTRALEYLDKLDTIKADFIQTTPEGRELTGTFYLDRPGQLRFEYDNPVEDFIVADGTFIYFYDAELGQQSNAPIGSTMADYILREDPGLDDEVMVSNVDKSRDMVKITLKRRNKSQRGKITLGFARNPYRLKQWRVVDSRGAVTDTRLKAIKSGLALDPDLFVYRNPRRDKPAYNE